MKVFNTFHQTICDCIDAHAPEESKRISYKNKREIPGSRKEY